MAADVTLIALPADTTVGPYAAMEAAEFLTKIRLFPDDKLLHLGDLDLVDRGEEFKSLCRSLWSQPPLPDHIEIGPWSPMKAELMGSERYLPGPTAAIHSLWERPKYLTPGLASRTVVLMNLPDRSHYRTSSKRGTGTGKYKWPSLRKARPRQLRRWLDAHIGHVVWAESW